MQLITIIAIIMIKIATSIDVCIKFSSHFSSLKRQFWECNGGFGFLKNDN